MADSVSTEAWLDQRRWAALEEALKAQGSNDEWISLRKCGIVLLHGQPTGA